MAQVTTPTMDETQCHCTKPDVTRVEDMVYACISCGDPVQLSQDDMPTSCDVPASQTKTTKRSALNLSWPKSVMYTHGIEDLDDIPGRIIQYLDARSALHALPLCLAQLPSDSPVTPEVSKGEATSTSKPKKTTAWAVQDHEHGFLGNDLDALQGTKEMNRLQFRLFRLSPGAPDDILHGTLEVASLAEHPEYEAVSYTWADEYGDSARQRPVYLIASNGQVTRLAVTANCEATLCRLRHKNRDRLLWIDAICINQKSSFDRATHANLTHRIFSSAARVLVYLGETSESVDLDKAIEGVNSEIEFLSYQPQEYARALFQLPYFNRVWTMQEMTAAKSIVLLTPSTETCWKSFHLSSPIHPSITDMVPAHITQCRFPLSRLDRSLTDWVLNTSSLKASRPEDKIFALFGIFGDRLFNGLIADYRLSVEQVYTGMAAYLVLNLGCLEDLLEHVDRNNTSIEVLKLDLPSWVPDFRCEPQLPWGNLPDDATTTTTTIFVKEQEPRNIQVLKATGSLVLHGHGLFLSRIFVASKKQTVLELDETHDPSFFNVTVWFRMSYDPDLDLILLPSTPTGAKPLLMHLRYLETENCYAFRGCCSLQLYQNKTRLALPKYTLSCAEDGLSKQDFEDLMIIYHLDQWLEGPAAYDRFTVPESDHGRSPSTFGITFEEYLTLYNMPPAEYPPHQEPKLTATQAKIRRCWREWQLGTFWSRAGRLSDFLEVNNIPVSDEERAALDRVEDEELREAAENFGLMKKDWDPFFVGKEERFVIV